MGHVWLLWMNDAVLGVYGSETKANEAAEHERIKLGGSWSCHLPTADGQRWYQPWGPIARLEIERREVT